MTAPYWFFLKDEKQHLTFDVHDVLQACKEENVNFGAVQAVFDNLGVRLADRNAPR